MPSPARKVYAAIAWGTAILWITLMATGILTQTGWVEDLGKVAAVLALYFTGWVVGNGHASSTVRKAVRIDGDDDTDWQRGYRACANRALHALGDRRRTAATRKCPRPWCGADIGQFHSPVCQQPAERRS